MPVRKMVGVYDGLPVAGWVGSLRVNGELHRAAGVSTCLTAIRSWNTCKQPAYSYLTPHKP